MIKRKRGRPKGSTKQSAINPHNYSFWVSVLSKEEETNLFLEKASKDRLLEMAETLKYLKRTDEYLFTRFNGEKILTKITERK